MYVYENGMAVMASITLALQKWQILFYEVYFGPSIKIGNKISSDILNAILLLICCYFEII